MLASSFLKGLICGHYVVKEIQPIKLKLCRVSCEHWKSTNSIGLGLPGFA